MTYPNEITVPFLLAPSGLLHTCVMRSWRTPADEALGLFRWATGGGPHSGLSSAASAGGSCRLEDEGRTWARGHVTAGDAEGRALLAAHALDRGPV